MVTQCIGCPGDNSWLEGAVDWFEHPVLTLVAVGALTTIPLALQLLSDDE